MAVYFSKGVEEVNGCARMEAVGLFEEIRSINKVSPSDWKRERDRMKSLEKSHSMLVLPLDLPGGDSFLRIGSMNFGQSFRHVFFRRGRDLDVGATKESWTAVANNVYHLDRVVGLDRAELMCSGVVGGSRETIVTASARV